MYPKRVAQGAIMAALTESVSIENHGAVAVITVNNPPVNAL
ncbi:MAG: hypothetical protein ACI9BK_002383, partial [Acidimicrobiales bacterium]